MALTTRLKAAEDGLLAALVAETGLAGIPLRLGDPGAGVRPEHVWIAEEATASQLSDLSAQTDGGREESFELQVKVIVTRSGDDYAALRDRATVLVQAIEHAVTNTRTLGGAVEDCEVIRIERTTGATEIGRGILHVVAIEARAWLV